MTIHQTLTQQLPLYTRYWAQYADDFADEPARLLHFSTLLEHPVAAYERSYFSPGHFTSSALVVAPDYSRILLTLHAKLGKWLQLGGHADGETDLLKVAQREVSEEAGIDVDRPIAYDPADQRLLLFDIDCHLIPAYGREPEHYHFDARFVYAADPELPVTISDESKDLRWFSLEDAAALTTEPSMQRLFGKLQILRAQSAKLRTTNRMSGNAVRSDLPLVE